MGKKLKPFKVGAQYQWHTEVGSSVTYIVLEVGEPGHTANIGDATPVRFSYPGQDPEFIDHFYSTRRDYYRRVDNKVETPKGQPKLKPFKVGASYVWVHTEGLGEIIYTVTAVLGEPHVDDDGNVCQEITVRYLDRDYPRSHESTTCVVQRNLYVRVDNKGRASLDD